MKSMFRASVHGVVLASALSLYGDAAPESVFIGTVEPISEQIAQEMTGRSWKPGCPVPLEDLRYLTLSYWGYDGQAHVGHMVVHKKIADEAVAIFKDLFESQFPIERMEIVDVYDADDDRSMAANNTSAFCCRPNTTYPGEFSKHSYGLSVDVNPKPNPYVRGDIVLPESGRAYLDRSRVQPGMITDDENNACYRAFVKYGYAWGGHFKGRLDYQHFEKDPSVLSRG